MTTKLPMLDATVAFKVDFIHLSTLGPSFVCSMFERYLRESELSSLFVERTVRESTLLAPVVPTADRWIITEDADINDAWGRGFQIQTHQMPWATESTVVLIQLMKFVRENGVTDKSCRMTFSITMPGLSDINCLEFLFFMNEQKNIARWSRVGRYMAKSHMEQLAAELHTNLFWHGDIVNWLENAHKSMSYDRGYTVNLGQLNSRTDMLDFSFVQGPHYEHQENELLHTLQDCLFACREAVMGRSESRMTFMNEARDFWKTHTNKKHPAARFRDPS